MSEPAKNNKKGLLVVISGFSGAGKGTLIRLLMKNYAQYSLSVSATTRKPREGELEGRDYFFVDEPAFLDMIDRDALLEYARYVDHYYGTPKSYVMSEIEKGRDVILEIETQGALKIKAKFPDSVLIFVAPPGAEELRTRLRNRGTESEEVIAKRLQKASLEIDSAEGYDYVLINDDLQESAAQLHELIQNQHMRVDQQIAFLEAFRRDLNRINKE